MFGFGRLLKRVLLEESRVQMNANPEKQGLPRPRVARDYDVGELTTQVAFCISLAGASGVAFSLIIPAVTTGAIATLSMYSALIWIPLTFVAFILNALALALRGDRSSKLGALLSGLVLLIMFPNFGYLLHRVLNVLRGIHGW